MERRPCDVGGEIGECSCRPRNAKDLWPPPDTSREAQARLSFRASTRNRLCQSLDLELLAARTVGEPIALVLSPPTVVVCCHRSRRRLEPLPFFAWPTLGVLSTTPLHSIHHMLPPNPFSRVLLPLCGQSPSSPARASCCSGLLSLQPGFRPTQRAAGESQEVPYSECPA